MLLGDERRLLAAATLFRLGCVGRGSEQFQAASRLLLDVVITATCPAY